MKRITFLLLFLFTIVACKKNRQATVLFINGDIEFPMTITLNNLIQKANREKYSDTIYVPSTFFFLINEMALSKEDTTITSSDNRILIESDSLLFAISSFNYAEIRQNNSSVFSKIDDASCYELRKIIGYYNHWDDESVRDCKEIKKYGLPKDYHFIDNENLHNPHRYTKILIIEK